MAAASRCSSFHRGAFLLYGLSYVAKIIDQVVDEGADALAPLWELSLEGGQGWDSIKVRLEATSLTFPKLSIERLPNGEAYYSDVEFPHDFSITVRESTNFKVFKYFQDWWDNVYDLDLRQFKSYAKTGKGSDGDMIHRHGSITFFSFVPESSETVDIKQREVDRSFSSEYSSRQLVQNILTGILKNTARSAVSSALGPVNEIAALAGKKVSALKLKPPKTTDVPHPVSVSELDSEITVASFNKYKMVEKARCVFTLSNLKITGLESVNLSYEGGPLKFNVNLSAEDIRGVIKS